MSTAGAILIENIKTDFHHYAFKPAQHNTEIVQAKLGNDAGITGAAGLIKTYIIERMVLNNGYCRCSCYSSRYRRTKCK